MANPHPKRPKSDKLWRDAIQRALCRIAAGKAQALEKVADALVACAIDGDIAAIKEIGDRIDGKVTQPIGGDSERPVFHDITIRFMENAKA